MSDQAKGGLVRLREIVEGCEGRTVSVAVTFTPTTQEVNLSVNGDEFIPGVAIHTGNNDHSYRTLGDLANDLIDDLAAAAITAHANEPTAKKRRRR